MNLSDLGDTKIAENDRIWFWSSPGFGEETCTAIVQSIACTGQGFDLRAIDKECNLVTNTIKAQFIFSQAGKNGRRSLLSQKREWLIGRIPVN